MIDEVQAVRRAFEAPARDPDARARALRRLREAMAAEQPAVAEGVRGRRMTHPTRWLGVAAAVVATLLVAQVMSWRHDSASSALRHLSAVASAQHAVEIPADSVLLATSQGSNISDKGSAVMASVGMTSGQEWDLLVQFTVQTKVGPDGSGSRVTTIDKVSFATDQDEAAWIAAGKPDKLQAGDTRTERFTQEDLTYGYDLSTLPTDPDPLESALRQVAGRQRDDQQVMDLAANLLTDANPPPALRAALFQVLANVPGIKLLGQVTDPIGRTGTGLLIPAGPANKELIFDESTSAVLATLDLPANGGPAYSWRVITDSIVTQKAA